MRGLLALGAVVPLTPFVYPDFTQESVCRSASCNGASEGVAAGEDQAEPVASISSPSPGVLRMASASSRSAIST